MNYKQNKSEEIKYRVLLLSAPIGAGHKLAAEALEQLLRKRPDVEVTHGNVFDFFPHILGTAFLRTYLWILQTCPWVYELAYKWGNREGGSLWLRSLLNRLLALLGSGYLQRVAPDAVIATHATPAGIMRYYKEKHPHMWLGAVITDYTIHRWWLCEGVDTYFIADEALRNKITMPAEVIASGIPIRQAFLQTDACQRTRYGWQDEEHVCLLMGGGEGLLPMEEILGALRQAQISKLRIVAITGRNEKLESSLRARFLPAKAAQGSTQIEVHGFREDVPALMQAADIIITKAGGLTSAEVLASKLDFVIYKPLPGQEQGNADFLSEHCGVRVAKDMAQLTQAVRSFCDNAHAPSGKRYFGKPEAAHKICSYVLDKLAQNKKTTDF